MKGSEIAIPRRLYHWVNLLSMVILGITGWYIHQPFTSDMMGIMRYIHLGIAYIFSINPSRILCLW